MNIKKILKEHFALFPVELKVVRFSSKLWAVLFIWIQLTIILIKVKPMIAIVILKPNARKLIKVWWCGVSPESISLNHISSTYVISICAILYVVPISNNDPFQTLFLKNPKNLNLDYISTFSLKNNSENRKNEVVALWIFNL